MNDDYSRPGIKIIEVLEDGKNVVGAIYPTEKGLKIVSLYVTDPKKAIEIDKSTTPTAILMNFLS